MIGRRRNIERFKRADLLRGRTLRRQYSGANVVVGVARRDRSGRRSPAPPRRRSGPCRTARPTALRRRCTPGACPAAPDREQPDARRARVSDRIAGRGRRGERGRRGAVRRRHELAADGRAARAQRRSSPPPARPTARRGAGSSSSRPRPPPRHLDELVAVVARLFVEQARGVDAVGLERAHNQSPCAAGGRFRAAAAARGSGAGLVRARPGAFACRAGRAHGRGDGRAGAHRVRPHAFEATPAVAIAGRLGRRCTPGSASANCSPRAGDGFRRFAASARRTAADRARQQQHRNQGRRRRSPATAAASASRSSRASW